MQILCKYRNKNFILFVLPKISSLYQMFFEKLSLFWMVPILHFQGLMTTKATEIKSREDAVTYLKQFGYISKQFATTPRDGGKDDFMNEEVSMFQTLAGIKTTGKLDELTMSKMNMMRCGRMERMDMLENKNMSQSMLSHKIPKRLRRWGKLKLFYKVHNLPHSISDRDIVRKEIRRAFRLWEEVTDLECKELKEADTRRQADIDMKFVVGNHGDGERNAFGESSIGNVVAHAFFPDHVKFHGDIHFDNTRSWTAYNFTGVNLFQVAAHEIGHALGLDHSMYPDSVMNMIVHAQLKDDFHLHGDDIQGIQKLYGKKLKRSRKPKIIFPSSGKPSEFSRYETNDVSTEQEQPSNENHFVEITKLENPLTEFWNCFALSFNQDEVNRETSECYKRNALRLFYSIKL